MNKVIIRPTKLADLHALRRLFIEAVQAHFTYFPAFIQDRVIRDHSLFRLAKASLHHRRLILVALDGRRLIGYAIGSVPAGGSAQLYWLYVDPRQRGRNIGLSLLSRALKHLGQQGAHEVVLATHDHRRYYERQGFAWQERRLVDGVAMDIMVFRLEGR